MSICCLVCFLGEFLFLFCKVGKIYLFNRWGNRFREGLWFSWVWVGKTVFSILVVCLYDFRSRRRFCLFFFFVFRFSGLFTGV